MLDTPVLMLPFLSLANSKASPDSKGSWLEERCNGHSTGRVSSPASGLSGFSSSVMSATSESARSTQSGYSSGRDGESTHHTLALIMSSLWRFSFLIMALIWPVLLLSSVSIWFSSYRDVKQHVQFLTVRNLEILPLFLVNNLIDTESPRL